MAATLLGRHLTEAHRVAQIQIQAATIQDLHTIWPLLDPTKDASFEGYSRAAKVVIGARKAQSAQLASAYFTAYRTAEGAKAPAAPALSLDLNGEQAMTSLYVTGPVQARRALGAGISYEQAVQSALVASSGAAARLAAEGGRETLVNSLRSDDEAHGFARVTSGRSCAFCAMLAGRGAAYFSEDTASFEAHDHCGCSAEGVYTPRSQGRHSLPPGSQKYADLYAEVAKGQPNPLQAFRAAYEAPDSTP